MKETGYFSNDYGTARGRFLGWTHADMQTDPQDAASRLELTGLSGGTNLIWKAVQGLSYRVLSRTNLSVGVWGEEAANIPGTPPESSLTVSNTHEQVFYKIETE